MDRHELHVVHRYITSVSFLSLYIKGITITSNGGMVYFTLERLLLFLELGFHVILNMRGFSGWFHQLQEPLFICSL